MFVVKKLSDEVSAVAVLAAEIWREHYTPIIGEAQVEYMLEKFQSAEQISRDISSNGHVYYIAVEEDIIVGYCCVIPHEDFLLISKLYVRKDHRGQGIAKGMLDEAIGLSGFDIIRLTVNKYNSKAIDAHKKNGFVIVDSVKKDIGGGFFMDDYVMELSLREEKKL